MAYIRYLILLTTLLTFSSISNAALQKGYVIQTDSFYPTTLAAEEAYKAIQNPNLCCYQYTTATVVQDPETGFLVVNFLKDNGETANNLTIATIRYRCTGSTINYDSPQTAACPVDTTPTCLSQQTLVNNQCVCTDITYPQPISVVTKGDNSDAASICKGGCQFTTGNSIVLSVHTNPTTYTDVRHRTTTQCTETTPAIAPEPPPTTTEKTCTDAGKGFATINGITTCASTSQTDQKITTASQSTNQKTTIQNGVTTITNDNSTKTTTINNDGTITTTTTVTTPDGKVTTDKKTQDKQSFCDENPSIQICKTTTLNTACQGFSCDGDAIQCAIAKRAYNDRCEADDSKNQITAKKSYATGKNYKTAFSIVMYKIFKMVPAIVNEKLM